MQLTFLLYSVLLATWPAQVFTTSLQVPVPECGISPFPSPAGNPLPSFDGSFESSKPLAQGLFDVGGTLTVGCICKKGFQGPLKEDPLGGIPLLELAGLNDATCNASCVETEARLGHLPGSKSFFTAPSGPGPRLAVFFIAGETLSLDRPNLQFYMAFEDGSAGTESYAFSMSYTFVEFLDSGSVNNFRVPLVQLDSLNDTDCDSTKWARFTVSLAPLLESEDFKNVNFSLRGSLIGVTFTLDDQQVLGLDNIEFVGPPLIDQSQIDALALPELQTQLKTSELSILGQDPLDAFFTVVAIMSLVAAMTVVVLALRSDSLARAGLVVRGFALGWLLVSTALTIYAVLEYFEFVLKVREFDLASQALAEEVQQVLQTPGFDPRQLGVITDGKAVYGAYSLPFPRIDRSVLETLFVVQSGSQSICMQTRLSPGSCAASVDEFYEFLNSTARLDESTAPLRNWEFMTAEGIVTPSQDHFLPLVLVSLVFDIIVTLLLVAGILLSRFCNLHCTDARRKVRKLETVFTLINLGLVVALLVLALSEPIRYTVSLNLVDFRYKVGLNVEPKEELLVTDGIGGLKLDTSSIGNVDACFTGTTSVKSQLISVYFEGLIFGTGEELYPGTVGTDRETCAWSESSAFTRGDGAACISLDCASGGLQLVQPEAVESLYNFVVSQVIFGIILVDLFISLVDVCVLLQVYIIERRASRDGAESVSKL